MLPVPIGVKGEICIAGVAVGRGYVNEPDKTADNFMMNPFRTDQKERMYRTGDIGSWREDGALYYHGRLDYRVKIRGFRIELGDIESQLLVNPKVKEAAVIVNETKQNTKTLVAFYSGDIEAVILREYIQSKLPGYMVPHSFHRLETLPKNNSGKIDRKILTHTENVDADRTELSISPNEQIIGEVWAEVLGIPIPETNDNFFKLGGDSIACFQIINRLAVRGYQLSVRDIFSHPTVFELARVMKSEPVISAMDKVILDEPFPLSPVQALSLRTHKAVRLRQNQVVVVKTGPLDKNKLEQALLETIKCHPMLYAQLIVAKNEYKQVLRNPSQLRFVLETSAGDIDANRSQFINQIAQSIDASSGQMFAAGIITDICNVELYLVAHHFACDAISWDIFLNDLEQNYQAMIQGTDITPMNEYTSYQYWVTQLLKTFFDHDQDYWQDVIDLAQNFKAPLLTSQSDEVVPELAFINDVVAENIESDLGDFIRKYDNESLVHSIFALALGRWTSTTAVSYMNEKHGRDISSKSMNLSQSIGWFTALYPVSITTEATFERQVIEVQQYLKQVKNPHGYGVLLTYGKRPLVGNEPPITLNYLGRMDRDNQPSIFSSYTLTYEGAVEADSFNSSAIEFNIAWNQAALDVEIAYRRDKVDTQSIKELIQHMKNIISEVKLSIQPTDGVENSFGISDSRLNGILGRLKTSSED